MFDLCYFFKPFISYLLLFLLYNIVKFKNKIKFKKIKKKKERTAYGLLCLQSKTSGLALPGYLVESWLIRAPKQGAIHTLGSIQLQLKSKEANS